MQVLGTKHVWTKTPPFTSIIPGVLGHGTGPKLEATATTTGTYYPHILLLCLPIVFAIHNVHRAANEKSDECTESEDAENSDTRNLFDAPKAS